MVGLVGACRAADALMGGAGSLRFCRYDLVWLAM